jgi:hypothetical protein
LGGRSFCKMQNILQFVIINLWLPASESLCTVRGCVCSLNVNVFYYILIEMSLVACVQTMFKLNWSVVVHSVDVYN